MTDIWSQKTVYQAEFPITARVSRRRTECGRRVRSHGRIPFDRCRDGQAVIDEKLEAVSDLQAIHTLRAGDELFLFVTARCSRNSNRSGSRPIIRSSTARCTRSA